MLEWALHRRSGLVLVAIGIMAPYVGGHASARERLSPRQREALLRDVRGGALGARNRAAARLYHLQDTEANAGLHKMARHSHPKVRAAGVWAMGAVRPLGAAVPVFRALRDAHGVVRCAAADAAGMLRLAKAAPQLGKLLADGQRNVRIAAVRALSRLGKAALLPLERAFATKGEVPLLAVEALARIPGRGSSALLEKAARKRDLELRLLAAAKLLERLNPFGSKVLRQLLLRHRRANVRARAAKLLARDHSDVGRRTLSRALRDPDRQVRRAAADALARRSP